MFIKLEIDYVIEQIFTSHSFPLFPSNIFAFHNQFIRLIQLSLLCYKWRSLTCGPSTSLYLTACHTGVWRSTQQRSENCSPLSFQAVQFFRFNLLFGQNPWFNFWDCHSRIPYPSGLPKFISVLKAKNPTSVFTGISFGCSFSLWFVSSHLCIVMTGSQLHVHRKKVSFWYHFL